jgi:hypothetical protein
MLILIQMANTHTKVEKLIDDKNEEVESDYRRGQEWACTEFYTSDRNLDELRDRLVDTSGSYIPTDFESGALQSLQELKKKRKRKSRGSETKLNKKR